jgi:hypothetical protein
MTWDKDDLPLPHQSTLEDANRFRGRGTEMVKTTALAIVHILEDLPPREAESFADAFRETTERLATKQVALSVRRQEHPLELPDPLPRANVREFPKSRKRGMTGHEAAMATELDTRRAERRAAM